jgi:hypothetical protein
MHQQGAVFDPEKTGKGGGGLHGMEGQGGAGNDEQYITIWQTSPEESTRDGQNCKKRCVSTLFLAFLLA